MRWCRYPFDGLTAEVGGGALPVAECTRARELKKGAEGSADVCHASTCTSFSSASAALDMVWALSRCVHAFAMPLSIRRRPRMKVGGARQGLLQCHLGLRLAGTACAVGRAQRPLLNCGAAMIVQCSRSTEQCPAVLYLCWELRGLGVVVGPAATPVALRAAEMSAAEPCLKRLPWGPHQHQVHGFSGSARREYRLEHPAARHLQPGRDVGLAIPRCGGTDRGRAPPISGGANAVDNTGVYQQ